ncbi:MAG: diaminopimelate epimerase [Gammaproteobacteria bacterium (ex Lamellibrachia satsuma)]|nr:MAG: diaminopimelate epimerase [Gammaproteobacteria bacterium (ex Lamellibrachia satsuma)]RRS33761.1 MAG: diaminopimelate epimerase [Gammaproteobacteria bacterium (ex Lamellibrachia satsuma)]RRS37555.1 MAG: diaminopimelate epimerase [Gammaproteobacteria bacterium (ex Lamellibrachia satsuma)]
MQLAFTKMHGLGNDFVVIDAISQPVEFTQQQLRFVADRRFGIGCDQILLVEPPRDTATDFHYRIFNPDGSEVEQCGNGARCFAHFVRDKGLSTKNEIPVGTAAGRILLKHLPDGMVQVNMGLPQLTPAKIPFQAERQAATYDLEVGGERLTIAAVSMGNPHAVIQVDSVAQAPVQRLGPLIEHHARFPNRVNASFMEIVNPDHIKLRVFERGTGETLACGTGACAAVVAGRIQGLLNPQVRVGLPGGDLVVEWREESEPVLMSGPAATVFEGRIEL